MRVLLVHNPTSGDDDHGAERLTALLQSAGYDVDYHTSKSAWRDALNRNPDLIAVAGGDGTVGRVARAAVGRPAPLTILPTGTANNIAGSLGLTGVTHEELVRGWPHGAVRAFDVGVARGSWGESRFLEGVGVGLLAWTMRQIDQGGSAYVNDLARRSERVEAARQELSAVLADGKVVRCEIDLDDARLSGEYLLVEVLNIGAVGPNLQLAPGARTDDGVLDVVIVPETDRVALENYLAGDSAAEAAGTKSWVHRSRRVAVRCARCVAHIDDKLRRPDDEAVPFTAEASVEPGAIQFLIPDIASSPHPLHAMAQA